MFRIAGVPSILVMLALAAVLIGPRNVDAGEGAEPDPWSVLRFFEGPWKGTGRGPAGDGVAERSYEFILANKYLEIRHVSRFEPSEKNPDGEVHEDLGILSYDSDRKRIVLRQFLPEGYVNQYVMDPVDDGKTLVFRSESMENGVGWQARETVRILGENEFEETLELCPPNSEFFSCVVNRFQRVTP